MTNITSSPVSRELTLATLKRENACKPQCHRFAAMFGGSVDVTEPLCVQHADTVSWNWAADSLLSRAARASYTTALAPGRAIYDAAVASADMIYSAALASARAIYTTAVAPSLAIFDAAIAPARAIYDAAVASAQATYSVACAVAWARAYIADVATQSQDGT